MSDRDDVLPRENGKFVTSYFRNRKSCSLKFGMQA